MTSKGVDLSLEAADVKLKTPQDSGLLSGVLLPCDL
jgi:hypothetical protein